MYGPKRPTEAVIGSLVSGCFPNALGSDRYLSASSSVTSLGSLSFGKLARFGFSFFPFPLAFLGSPTCTYGPNLPLRTKISSPVSGYTPIGLSGSTMDPAFVRAPSHSGYFVQLINLPPRPSLYSIGAPHLGQTNSTAAGPRFVSFSMFSLLLTS